MKKFLIALSTLALFMLPQYQLVFDIIQNAPAKIYHAFYQPLEIDSNEDPEKSSIQVALLLDTSNSMDGLIEQAKSQLWKVVNELAEANKDGVVPKIEIALYQYGNSGLSMTKGYIQQVTSLTSNLDLISEKLFELKTNGGEEYCGWTIEDALANLEWSDDEKNLKLIFIAGNEPFDQGPKDFRTACKEALNNDVIVNTVFCGNYQKGIKTFWKEGADITGGDYMNIDKDKTVVHIPTPYDEIIIKLNKDLNKTYIYYGRGGLERHTRQSLQDDNASAYGSANSRTRASFKAKESYKNTEWDMVDAMEENEALIDEVDTKTLPEELQGLSKDELKTYVEEQGKKRQAIKKEILENEQNVREFIAAKQKETGEELTLDKAMLESVRKQAQKKNFKFD